MFIRVEIKAYKRQFNASNYCADTTLSLREISDVTYVTRSFARADDTKNMRIGDAQCNTKESP